MSMLQFADDSQFPHKKNFPLLILSLLLSEEFFFVLFEFLCFYPQCWQEFHNVDPLTIYDVFLANNCSFLTCVFCVSPPVVILSPCQHNRIFHLWPIIASYSCVFLCGSFTCDFVFYPQCRQISRCPVAGPSPCRRNRNSPLGSHSVSRHSQNTRRNGKASATETSAAARRQHGTRHTPL